MEKMNMINDMTKDDMQKILKIQYKKNECVNCFEQMTAENFGKYLENVNQLDTSKRK